MGTSIVNQLRASVQDLGESLGLSGTGGGGAGGGAKKGARATLNDKKALRATLAADGRGRQKKSIYIPNKGRGVSVYNRDDVEQSSSEDSDDNSDEFAALVAAQAQKNGRGAALAHSSGDDDIGEDNDDDAAVPLGIPIRRADGQGGHGQQGRAPVSVVFGEGQAPRAPAKPSRITDYRAGGKMR